MVDVSTVYRQRAGAKENHDDHFFARHQAGPDRHAADPGRLRRLGHRRRRLGLRLGRQDDASRSPPSATRSSPGINWIDTAAVYGLGHSEEVVAACWRALPGRPARRVHQVRPGLGPADRAAKPRRVLGARRACAEVEASLRRLGVERDRPVPVALARRDRHPGGGVLGGLRSTLKARARSGRSACPTTTSTTCDAAEAIGHVDSLQPPFSLINRDAAERRSVVRRARHRRDRLQPDAVGPAHRRVHRRAGGRAGAGRLAALPTPSSAARS